MLTIKYKVLQGKSFLMRKVIKDQYANNIEGITFEDFQMTFGSEELMKMPLQTDKVASIKQIISLYKTT